MPAVDLRLHLVTLGHQLSVFRSHVAHVIRKSGPEGLLVHPRTWQCFLVDEIVELSRNVQATHVHAIRHVYVPGSFCYS